MFTSSKSGGEFNSIRGPRKTKKDAPTSRSFLQGGSSLRDINSGRLSLSSSIRVQKIASNSLEKLSCISEKDGCSSSEFENYELEYSTYLLRKLQNKVLAKDKDEREKNVKKCFISLKLEYEELLNKNVKLKEDIAYFKMYFETIEESSKRIKIGENILDILRKNKFEILLKSLSEVLDHKINQLQLIDFDRGLLEEAFSKKILGEGSEVDKSLKKINDCTKKNKEQISKIAEKLLTIKKLCIENSVLRERCYNIFKSIADDFLEINYEQYTGAVVRAFKQRQELRDSTRNDIELFNFDELLKRDLVSSQQSNMLSKLETSCPMQPNSSSTPKPDN